MHIEPGIVNGAKLILSYASGIGVSAIALRMSWETIRDSSAIMFAIRSLLATMAVFVFFEILPHYPVGVSEVHFILGSSLFLLLGSAPTAIGLALGLFIQGFFFAPFDLPQYGINLTTLLVPLFSLHYLAKKFIAPNTAYVNLRYRDTLMLSSAFQGGIVAWVAFWAFFGQGFTAETMITVTTFGSAYLSVVLVEPLVDLGLLASAKLIRDFGGRDILTSRVYNAAG